ncbi:MAG: hypothetical protein IH899_22480 [Planctomycetes bacterium]|nr:hypothetical protein [Planctomycetota bacterium]
MSSMLEPLEEKVSGVELQAIMSRPEDACNAFMTVHRPSILYNRVVCLRKTLTHPAGLRLSL